MPEPSAPSHKPVLAIAARHVGDPDDGAAVVQPIRDLGSGADHIAAMPYTAIQAALDATAPPGMRSYWRGEYLRELSDAAIDTFPARGRPLRPNLFRLNQNIRPSRPAAVPA